ncbi:replication initiator protein RepSA [Microlunatus ginsengisoli]|uniref:Replication initiator protein RepSA n=1 Tax=Microlunatus ginsengisoli TaxID=363863 RepID=A0ABP6ZJ54_9ACTN
MEQVGHCAHPIRVTGCSDTIDATTGVVLASYSSGSEPDGITYLRCGNRRRAVCPSCSFQYQGDVFHLIMAGAAGGSKDVPASVVTHPLVFATLTAPSFGLVHAAKKPGRSGGRRCRPRSGDGRKVCPHGRPRWCMAVHQHTDPLVGDPLCVDCYDYHAQLVWQWWAPELWRRFTITLRRQLARHLGISEAACRRRVRVQFAKVAEFQRRGLVHFHALIRLDGPPTATEDYPPPRIGFGADTLAELVETAAGMVSCEAAPVDAQDVPRLLRFGRQVDARPVHDQADRDHPEQGGGLHPETVSAYVAKYATKAAADVLDGTGSAGRHLVQLRQVLGRLVVRATIAGLTGADGPYKGWGRWVDMLGFRGHFATKSRRYSTTLGRLRQVRRDYTRRRHLDRQRAGDDSAAGWADRDDQDQAEPTTLVIGSWRFAGIGWLTTGDAALAAASAARARDD